MMTNIDTKTIQTYFPKIEFPYLFLDKIEEIIPGEYAKGYKNFTYNEWFFPAHFEDEPNVPGFIQLEMLSQMFLLTFLTIPGNEKQKTGLLEAKTNLRKKIIPGDRLYMESRLHSFKYGVATGETKGYINNELVCEGKFKTAIIDILNQYIPQKLN